MRSDAFGCIWMRLDAFGTFRKNSEILVRKNFENGFELKDVFIKMFIIEIGTKRCTMAYNIMPLSVFDVARNLVFFRKVKV